MNRGRLGRTLTAFAILLTLPLGASGQEIDEPSPIRLDARLAIGAAGGDGGIRALSAEIAVRNRGPILLGVAAGVVNSWDHEEYVTEPVVQFEGRPVWVIGGKSRFRFSPRIRGLAGYVFDYQGRSLEPTIEWGWAKASWEEFGSEEEGWQPWAVGALTVRGQSGLGVGVGLGGHRVAVSYEDAFSGGLVDKFYSWKPFIELVFSLPLN
jgi:hypothetical protein